MSVCIDYLFLFVNDLDVLFGFYCNILGFEWGGMYGLFEMIKVNRGILFFLIQYVIEGGMYLVFSFFESEFNEIFEWIKFKCILFGDWFDCVDNG